MLTIIEWKDSGDMDSESFIIIYLIVFTFICAFDIVRYHKYKSLAKGREILPSAPYYISARNYIVVPIMSIISAVLIYVYLGKGFLGAFAAVSWISFQLFVFRWYWKNTDEGILQEQRDWDNFRKEMKRKKEVPKERKYEWKILPE